jgi:hypothetical protein
MSPNEEPNQEEHEEKKHIKHYRRKNKRIIDGLSTLEDLFHMMIKK